MLLPSTLQFYRGAGLQFYRGAGLQSIGLLAYNSIGVLAYNSIGVLSTDSIRNISHQVEEGAVAIVPTLLAGGLKTCGVELIIGAAGWGYSY